MLKRYWPIIGSVIVGIAGVLIVGTTTMTLQSCGCQGPISPLPTPLPTLSSPVPPPMDVRRLGTVVTGTTKIWWDDPLVLDVTACISVTDDILVGDDYELTFTCGPRESMACANYPFTLVVSTDEITAVQETVFTLVVDLEARQGDQVLDETTLPTPLFGAKEPGTGQLDGDVPWEFDVALLDSVDGTVEIWERNRWIDPDHRLPDVAVPYYEAWGELQKMDDRGFFLVADVEVPTMLYRYYVPILVREVE